MLERGEADIDLWRPRRADRAGQEQPQADAGAGAVGSLVARVPGLPEPEEPVPRQAGAPGGQPGDRPRGDQRGGTASGFGKVSGNWINNDVEYALEWPEFERNLDKARQLMKEAGYPNGFKVDWLTPLPPYYSRGERVVSQLRAIGIRAKLQVMERGVFLKKLQGRLEGMAGGADHLAMPRASAAPGRTGTRRFSSAAASAPRTASACRSSTRSSRNT